jgi:Gpi18-like mannosyltransferase
MLGMYKVKALYIHLAVALTPAFGEIGAMRFISTVSTAATGLVFMLWLYRRNAFAYAPAVIGFLLISGFADVARLGSPDAFFMALLSFGLYLYDRQKLWLAGLALFLATLVRSDTVVFLAAWSVLIVLFRVKALPIVAAFGAALVAYPLVTHAANHPGFWAHFIFSTTEQQLTMAGFHPTFSIAVYVRAIAVGLVRTFSETSWPAAVGLVLPLWVWLRSRTTLLSAREDALIIALVAGVIGRFILFPLPDTRIHGAYLTPLLVLLLPAVTAYLTNIKVPSRAV